MKSLFYFLTLFLLSIHSGMAQDIIELPITKTNDVVSWDNAEKEYHSSVWDTDVITNVSKPSLLVFRPNQDVNNGTSVIICPGGGLYAHSINSEGRQVAQWLADRGVTAFVLKYRLVPTEGDGTMQINTDGAKVMENAALVLPLAVDDGLNAITYVRENAEAYGIDPQKIGIIGFSAGGAVTMGVTYNYTESNRPNFIGPIYAWMIVVPEQSMPEDAPPIFVACATDDPLRLAPASVKLYEEWALNGKSSELHMYAKGGHGFGMRVQNLPSDKWIEHFGEWLKGQGLL